jgi:hypothetical protein
MVASTGTPRIWNALTLVLRSGFCWIAPQSQLPPMKCRTVAGGTGSSPPRANGWQRNNLNAARALPRSGPWVEIAIAAYSEHVGKYLHPP